jgi:hypothetical protein
MTVQLTGEQYITLLRRNLEALETKKAKLVPLEKEYVKANLSNKACNEVYHGRMSEYIKKYSAKYAEAKFESLLAKQNKEIYNKASFYTRLTKNYPVLLMVWIDNVCYGASHFKQFTENLNVDYPIAPFLFDPEDIIAIKEIKEQRFKSTKPLPYSQKEFSNICSSIEELNNKIQNLVYLGINEYSVFTVEERDLYV